MLAAPDANARRVAQALLGDRVEIESQRGDWVRTAELGGSWRGWIQATQLTYGSAQVRHAFVTMPPVALAAAPYLAIDACGNRAPFGARLPLAKESGARRELQLPDGRTLEVGRSDINLPGQPEPLERTLLRVDGLLRRTFQTGGNSPEAIDGAGLVYLVLRASGREVPREPAALWTRATPIRRREMRPGDLLFFEAFDGQPPRPAMLVTDRVLLEASPANGVNYTSLDQLAQRRVQGVRRLTGRPPATSTRPQRAIRHVAPARRADEVNSLTLLIVVSSQQAMLAALIIALRGRALDSARMTRIAHGLDTAPPRRRSSSLFIFKFSRRRAITGA